MAPAPAANSPTQSPCAPTSRATHTRVKTLTAPHPTASAHHTMPLRFPRRRGILWMLSSSSPRSSPSMTQWPPGSPLDAVLASLHRHRAMMICGMHEPAALPLAVRAMPTSLGPSSSHRIDPLGHSFLIKRHPQIIAWLLFLRVHPSPSPSLAWLHMQVRRARAMQAHPLWQIHHSACPLPTSSLLPLGMRSFFFQVPLPLSSAPLRTPSCLPRDARIPSRFLSSCVPPRGSVFWNMGVVARFSPTSLFCPKEMVIHESHVHTTPFLAFLSVSVRPAR